jgi:hypothetical protein
VQERLCVVAAHHDGQAPGGGYGGGGYGGGGGGSYGQVRPKALDAR